MPQRPQLAPPLPRIRIISDGRFPSHDTNTQQIMKNAAAMARAGLDVELCIPSRNRWNFVTAKTFRERLFSYYNVSGPLAIRRSRTLPAGRFRPERIIHGITTPFAALFRNIKIFYSRDPISTLLAMLLGRRVIFETYRCLGDDYPRAMRFLSRFARSRRFLGIITHSRHAADSIARAGFPPEKLAPIHNGFDPADMEPVLDRTAARKACGLPLRKFLAVYTGNMQANKGVESIIELAAAVPETTFVLVGGTPADIARLEETAAASSCRNVIFTGMKPVGEVPRYLHAADVLLIPPTAAPLKLYGRTVLPFKTFLYMAAGRPILGPDLPDLREVLTARSALLVTPDDTRAAARALARLAKDPALCKRTGTASARAAAKLTWDQRGLRIASWIAERYHASLGK